MRSSLQRTGQEVCTSAQRLDRPRSRSHEADYTALHPAVGRCTYALAQSFVLLAILAAADTVCATGAPDQSEGSAVDCPSLAVTPLDIRRTTLGIRTEVCGIAGECAVQSQVKQGCCSPARLVWRLLVAQVALSSNGRHKATSCTSAARAVPAAACSRRQRRSTGQPAGHCTPRPNAPGGRQRALYATVIRRRRRRRQQRPRWQQQHPRRP